MKRVVIAMFAVGIILSLSSLAKAVETGYFPLGSIGCHSVNDICMVELATPTVWGPPACRSTFIRFKKSDPGGQNSLAVLTAAFMGGRPVNFSISDTCFSAQPTFPTFTFFTVH